MMSIVHRYRPRQRATYRLEPASLRDRIIAQFIDGIILGALCGIIYWTLSGGRIGSIWVSPMIPVYLLEVRWPYESFAADAWWGGAFTSIHLYGSKYVHVAFPAPLPWLLYGAYYTAGCTYWGQTPGKMLKGLVILDHDRDLPGLRAALLRWAGYPLSLLPLGAGFWSAAVTDGHRTWHDRLSGTAVFAFQDR